MVIFSVVITRDGIMNKRSSGLKPARALVHVDDAAILAQRRPSQLKMILKSFKEFKGA